MAARPITRARAQASGRAAPRVRDLRRLGDGPSVEWDVRTAYDFVFSLSDDAGTSDDLPASDRTWLEEGKARVRVEVGDALDQYARDTCILLASLAIDRPAITDAASFLEALRSSSPESVVRLVLGEGLRDPEQLALTERALAGDEAAITQAIDRLLAEHDGAGREMVEAMYREPRRLVSTAVKVFSAWLPIYEAIEPRVESMIRRDADLRAADRATLGPIELIERTTGGIRWLSEAGVHRVILAPSYFARPFNFLLGGLDWRLFGYPISDAAIDAADPLAPPASVVRLHRALGDETRLRILRLLRDRDLYLTEIAQELDLSKPTIKHHMVILRSAGLVTVTESGSVIYYSLRASRLDDASGEIKHFLLG